MVTMTEVGAHQTRACAHIDVDLGGLLLDSAHLLGATRERVLEELLARCRRGRERFPSRLSEMLDEVMVHLSLLA